VQGINDGLEIKGKGTFKFKVEEEDGLTHKIKIPNSLYLPGLERCLLLPPTLGAGGRRRATIARRHMVQKHGSPLHSVLGPEAFPKVGPAQFINEHTSLLHGPFVKSLPSFCFHI
jgi:hypothetical protein